MLGTFSKLSCNFYFLYIFSSLWDRSLLLTQITNLFDRSSYVQEMLQKLKSNNTPFPDSTLNAINLDNIYLPDYFKMKLFTACHTIFIIVRTLAFNNKCVILIYARFYSLYARKMYAVFCSLSNDSASLRYIYDSFVFVFLFGGQREKLFSPFAGFYLVLIRQIYSSSLSRSSLPLSCTRDTFL